MRTGEHQAGEEGRQEMNPNTADTAATALGVIVILISIFTPIRGGVSTHLSFGYISGITRFVAGVVKKLTGIMDYIGGPVITWFRRYTE